MHTHLIFTKLVPHFSRTISDYYKHKIRNLQHYVVRLIMEMIVFTYANLTLIVLLRAAPITVG